MKSFFYKLNRKVLIEKGIELNRKSMRILWIQQFIQYLIMKSKRTKLSNSFTIKAREFIGLKFHWELNQTRQFLNCFPPLKLNFKCFALPIEDYVAITTTDWDQYCNCFHIFLFSKKPTQMAAHSTTTKTNTRGRFLFLFFFPITNPTMLLIYSFSQTIYSFFFLFSEFILHKETRTIIFGNWRNEKGKESAYMEQLINFIIRPSRWRDIYVYFPFRHHFLYAYIYILSMYVVLWVYDGKILIFFKSLRWVI